FPIARARRSAIARSNRLCKRPPAWRSTEGFNHMEHLGQQAQPAHGTVVVHHAPAPAGRMAHIEVPAPYYTADAGDGPDSAGLFEYWRMIRRHKKTLCLSAFCGLVLAGVVGIVMKPVYKVHTSIEVLNVNEDFMNMKQTSPETTSDFSYDTSEEETQA